MKIERDITKIIFIAEKDDDFKLLCGFATFFEEAVRYNSANKEYFVIIDEFVYLDKVLEKRNKQKEREG